MPTSERPARPPPVTARLAISLAVPALAVALAVLGAGRSPLALAFATALILAAAAHLVLCRKSERAFEAEVAARQQAEQEARAASLAKDEVLANVSHDLRTGLNGVIGMTDLLLAADLEPQLMDQVETLETAGESLLALVDDLLDFSTIEAGRVALKYVDFGLRELVAGAVQLFRDEAEGKGVALTCEVAAELPDALHGDATRLRQVLTNLVGNAVKYTPEGEVAVTVERQVVAGGALEVRFVVRDTGIGVSPKDHPRLFQPFNRAESTTVLRLDGTGLGLAICQRLVEMMGGGIAFESTRRVGSTFWFHVPLRRSRERSAAPAASPVPGASRGRGSCRLLVVDDNAINRKVALGQLHALGYAAEAVEGGAQALAALAEGPWDAVLMDCQMPGLDGWETTRRWRRREAGTPIPVIGVTAHAGKGTRARCLAAGMDDLVVKPLRGRKLRAVLGPWLAAAERPAGRTPNGRTPAGRTPDGRTPDGRTPEDPIDVRALESLAHLEGGDDLLAATVGSYLAEARERLAAMRQALAAGDGPALAQAAHDLGGPSVYVGAGPLARLCGELEDLAREDDLEATADLLARVEEEYRRAAAELERVRG